MKSGVRSLLTIGMATIGLAACGTGRGLTEGNPYQALGSQEQVLAAAARQRALETLPSNAILEWRTDDGQAEGRIRPLATFRSTDGRYCRSFREEVEAASGSDMFTDVRCRTSSGRWLRPEDGEV
jgi:surface antigen